MASLERQLEQSHSGLSAAGSVCGDRCGVSVWRSRSPRGSGRDPVWTRYWEQRPDRPPWPAAS